MQPGNYTPMEPSLWVTHICRIKLNWQETEDPRDYEFHAVPAGPFCGKHAGRPYKFVMTTVQKVMTGEAADARQEENIREVREGRALQLQRSTRRQFERDHGWNTSKVKEAIVIGTNTGTHYLVFQQPLRWLERKLIAFQIRVGSEFAMLGSLTFTPTANRFFGGKYRSVDFSLASALRVDDVLEWRLGMTPACDSRFADFPCRPDGTNVVTNYGEISIPWTCPSALQDDDDSTKTKPDIWDEPRFAKIRALRQIPANVWEIWLQFLVGQFVTPPIVEEIQADSGVLQQHRKGNGRVKSFNPGQCYNGPRNRMKVIGRFFIFCCNVDGIEYFIVDSVDYGVALHLFATQTDAEMYAKGGAGRKQARQLRIHRRAHDEAGKWRTEHERFIRSTEFREKHAARIQEEEALAI